VNTVDILGSDANWFVGCGFTADHYLDSLRRYPPIAVVAATDHDQQRASQFCAYQSVKLSPSLEAMLADPNIEMIINLTNSSSHFEVSKACLEAGKHLYTEKPLATTFAQAQTLVELANAKGLYFSAAPCSLLGEQAQTLWKALRKNEIGTVHVAYAELEDGPFHLGSRIYGALPRVLTTTTGESRDGRYDGTCGVLSELVYGLFGPAKTVTSFAATVWPTKEISPEETLHVTTPDFSFRASLLNQEWSLD